MKVLLICIIFAYPCPGLQTEPGPASWPLSQSLNLLMQRQLHMHPHVMQPHRGRTLGPSSTVPQQCRFDILPLNRMTWIQSFGQRIPAWVPLDDTLAQRLIFDPHIAPNAQYQNPTSMVLHRSRCSHLVSSFKAIAAMMEHQNWARRRLGGQTQPR